MPRVPAERLHRDRQSAAGRRGRVRRRGRDRHAPLRSTPTWPATTRTASSRSRPISTASGRPHRARRALDDRPGDRHHHRHRRPLGLRLHGHRARHAADDRQGRSAPTSRRPRSSARATSAGSASYTLMAAQADMIGLITADSGRSAKQVAPFGGREARIGTNPLSIAIPSNLEGPLFLDMATSAVAAGKISLAVSRGESIPLGWVVDRDGKPTTDPNDLRRGGALLPLGGVRGLQGQRPGGDRRDPVRPAHRVWASAVEPTGRHNDGCFIAVFNVAAFRPLAEFKREVTEFARYLKATPPSEGSRGVLYPGEIEYLTRTAPPPGRHRRRRRHLAQAASHSPRATASPTRSRSPDPQAATSPVSRSSQPEVLAQRLARVLGVIQPAPLQLGHDEAPQSPRTRPARASPPTTNPSHARSHELLLERVGHLFRPADDRIIRPPAVADSSMNSRTVGFALPHSTAPDHESSASLRSWRAPRRSTARPTPSSAKSKLSASDSNDSWSISSGSCCDERHLVLGLRLRRRAHRQHEVADAACSSGSRPARAASSLSAA